MKCMVWMQRFLLSGLALCHITEFLYSCDPYTVIATEQGSFPLRCVEKNDVVVSYDCAKHKQLLRRVLRAEQYYDAHDVIEISYGDEQIRVDATQLVYLADKGGWIEAQQLAVGNKLQTAYGESVTISELRRLPHWRLCSISIESPHTIVIGRYHVIVHNHGSLKKCACDIPRISSAAIAVPAGLVAIKVLVGGVSYAMTSGGIIVTCAVTPVATVAVSTCGVAAALVSRVVKGRWFWQHDEEKSSESWICAAPVKRNSRDYDKSYANVAAATKGPEDYDKQQLIYEHNPKHGLYARGNISGAPDIKTGQLALNCSWEVPEKERARIGFYGGRVIKFHCHKEALDALYYHGFYIDSEEKVNRLDPEVKKVLMERGIVKHTGKLLR